MAALLGAFGLNDLQGCTAYLLGSRPLNPVCRRFSMYINLALFLYQLVC